MSKDNIDRANSRNDDDGDATDDAVATTADNDDFMDLGGGAAIEASHYSIEIIMILHVLLKSLYHWEMVLRTKILLVCRGDTRTLLHCAV